MIDREKIIRAVDSCFDYWLEQHGQLLPLELENVRQLKADALTLLKEQDKQFIEAFNTIRDAYNMPVSREEILLNYLLRNASCCEQKLLIDNG